MSTLSVSNITDGTDTVATSYVVNGSAKAWVNLNGIGTIAIRDSLNISSVTDISSGVHTFSYTSSMSVADSYGITGAGNSGVVGIWGGNNTATSFRTYVTNYTGTSTDQNYVMYSIHGDLA